MITYVAYLPSGGLLDLTGTIALTGVLGVTGDIETGLCLSELTFFFGERIDSMAAPSGDPLTASDSFDSYLTGTITDEDWEDETVAGDLTTVTSEHQGSLTMTWTRDDGTSTHIYTGGSDIEIEDSTLNGRFNTTSGGDRWFMGARPVDIVPSTNVSFFGAYFTDVGDFDRQMTITLTDEDDVETAYVINHSLNGAGTITSSLFFWGFIDPTGLTYKKIRVEMSGEYTAGSGTVEDPHYTAFDDAFGIDDVRAGVLTNVSVC